jgi:hypothetical protein
LMLNKKLAKIQFFFELNGEINVFFAIFAF